jgi:glycosyltransferase involved in cell wall biosynthesis
MSSMTLDIAEQEHIRRDSPFRGRDMLCFSHDWNGDPLSKTHLMRLLARENRVLWVNSVGYRTPTVSKRDIARILRKLKAAAEPIRNPEKNIHVLNPLAIPLYGKPWIRKFNQRILRMQVKRAMGRLGFNRPINWVFNPAAAVIAGTIGEESLIYYCVDEYAAFSGVSSQSLAVMEAQLARRADMVIVSAERLLQSKKHLNPNTVLIRHGVDYDHFRKTLDPKTEIPTDIASLPRPIIGYFGLIASDWIDLPLVIRVAERFPEASLVMLGKTTMDISPLQRFRNIYLLGRKSYSDLPAYAKAFDVAIIPFPINEATLNSNPLKMREYLAAGLPVVSTAIPEVEAVGQCRIGRDADGFVRELESAMQDPGPSSHRSRAMYHESWESRLHAIGEHFSRFCPRCQA